MASSVGSYFTRVRFHVLLGFESFLKIVVMSKSHCSDLTIEPAMTVLLADYIVSVLFDTGDGEKCTGAHAALLNEFILHINRKTYMYTGSFGSVVMCITGA